MTAGTRELTMVAFPSRTEISDTAKGKQHNISFLACSLLGVLSSNIAKKQTSLKSKKFIPKFLYIVHTWWGIVFYKCMFTKYVDIWNR